MRNTNKKGFTIVELVVVVAVIAILAAVLIPTFSGIIRKANESKDIQLIRNLNVAVAAELNDSITMAEALAAATEYGFDIEKIQTKVVGNKILWDSVAKVFCYLNDGEVEYVSDVKNEGAGNQLWIIDNDGDANTDATYSSYVVNVANGATVNAKNNIDVTGCFNNVVVNYSEAGKIDIYTKAGDTVVINNDQAEVNHYGEAALADIQAVKSASYHLFGKVVTLKVTKGNVVPEATAKIQVLVVLADTAKVTAPVSGAKIDTVIVSDALSDAKATEIRDAVENVAEDVTEIPAADIESTIEKITTFAGGSGTAEDPYLIETAEHLQNIATQYELGYKYYKVADGVTSIDCSGWPKTIKLNGSFDGNGVTLTNLSYSLFEAVGVVGENSNVVLKNFTAIINTTAGTALVRNVYNAGKTTFENISLSGTIIGNYNMGSFYNYGTANASGSEGTDYEVEFINADSSITLICTSGNVAAGFIGHTFEGAGNGVTISIDKNSEFTGKILTTTGKGHLYFCMTSDYNNANNKFIIGGEEVKFDNGHIPSAANRGTIAVVSPQKGDAGYTVAKQDNVSYYVVSVHAQVDEYLEDGTLKPNGNGLTLVANSTKVENPGEKIFEKFNSVEIVNEYLKGEYGYAIENGVLKVFVGPRNALSGNISLQVTQYDANGNIVATGIATLGTIEK